MGLVVPRDVVVIALLVQSCVAVSKTNVVPAFIDAEKVSDLVDESPRIWHSFLSSKGSDNSDEVSFTRQTAWSAWSRAISPRAPNCMRSTINADKQLEATFCFVSPVRPSGVSLDSYSDFNGLVPEAGKTFTNLELGQPGDPNKEVTVFGNPSSFSTNSFIWGSPALDGYNPVQGWLFYPLASPGSSGASKEYMESSMRVKMCEESPEKCKNMYKLLQITGGFELDLSGKQRPEQEVATVSWALVHSKDNTNKNFEVLDEGYFVVKAGKIFVSESDLSSKSSLDKPAVVADFQPGQHIGLFIQVRLGLSDSKLSPDDVENNGWLKIVDRFVFRLIGDCKLVCDNGAVADLNLCICKCPSSSFWTGKFCDVCSLSCLHGNATSDCTSCECEEPWSGDHCEECPRECANGRLVEPLCECHCDGNWEGDLCDDCPLKCLNGGKLNKDTCECMCDQDQGWIGKSCDVCGRNCFNNGTLNEAKCTCSCTAPWVGSDCRDCNGVCYHGATLSSKTCTCENCPAPWSGDRCDKCTGLCLNGGKLLKSGPLEEPCKCECMSPWTGNSCEVCSRTCNAKSSISTVPNADCSCTCVGGWTGKFCDSCSLYQTIKNNGIVKDDCTASCPPEWTGTNCETCNIKCLNGGYRVGETAANPSQCYCVCPAGFIGRWCEGCDKPVCGPYSPWAGESTMAHGCDCRSNGACVNYADSSDRWCETCRHTCQVPGQVNTYLDTDLPAPVLLSGTKQCYCDCRNSEITGARCENDERNKNRGSGWVSVSQAPAIVETQQVCTACNLCFNWRSTDWCQCRSETRTRCARQGWWSCASWESYQVTVCYGPNPGRNPCIEWWRSFDHVCGWGETSCDGIVNGNCCGNYRYYEYVPYSYSHNGWPCGGKAVDVSPASRVLSGQCSETESSACFRVYGNEYGSQTGQFFHTYQQDVSAALGFMVPNGNANYRLRNSRTGAVGNVLFWNHRSQHSPWGDAFGRFEPIQDSNSFRQGDLLCFTQETMGPLFFRMTLNRDYPVTHITVNRGGAGPATAEVWTGNGQRQYKCGDIGTGVSTVACSRNNPLVKDIWITSNHVGRLRVCSIDVRYRP